MKRFYILFAALASTLTFSACEPVCDCNEPPLVSDYTGLSYGCGDFQVTRQSSDSLRFIVVRPVGLPIGLTRDTSFQVTLGDSSGFIVEHRRFAAPRNIYWEFCNDVLDDVHPVAIDTIRSGTAFVRAYGFGSNSPFTTYRVDVKLRFLVIPSQGLYDSIAIDSVYVGWLAG